MKPAAIVVLALLVFGVAWTARADEISLVPSETGVGLCEPFACGTHIQQVYDAALFPSAIRINGLTFYNLVENGSDGGAEPAVYQFTLSTTSRSSATLSADPASNLGADATAVLTWNVPTITTSFLTLQLPLITSSFLFDPSAGNLLLDIAKDRTGHFGDGVTYVDGSTQARGVAMLSNYLGEGQNTIRSHAGFTTTFSGQLVPSGTTPTPEPATLWLLGSGLAAIVRRARPVR